MGNLLDLFVFKYNRTDFHELNLDWIISDLKTLAETLQNFVNLNTIKYADPIQWNITRQYQANTVVIDGNTGTAYLSTKPVPSGVALTNTDYWTVIFTLDILSANQNITFRNDGANVNSTFPSAENDWLLWNSQLYKVTRNIVLNEAYVVGYNIERYSVELFIREYISGVKALIGSLTDLSTSDNTSVVDAINSIITERGNLNDLNTSDKTTIVNAINEVNTNVTNISSKFDFITPEDFGAVGDGITDDSDALIACFSSDELDEKYIKLRGTYKLTKRVIVKDNTIVKGVGIGTILDQYDTTGQSTYLTRATFAMNIISNVIFEGVNFIGTGAVTQYTAKYLLLMQNCSNIYFNNCNISNYPGVGCIYARDCDNVWVKHCKISDYTRGAINFVEGTSNSGVLFSEIANGHETNTPNRYPIMLNGYDEVYDADHMGKQGSRLFAIGNFIHDNQPFWEAIDAHGGAYIYVAYNRILNMANGISIFTNINRGFVAYEVHVHDNDVYLTTTPTTNPSTAYGNSFGGSRLFINHNRFRNGGRAYPSDNGANIYFDRGYEVFFNDNVVDNGYGCALFFSGEFNEFHIHNNEISHPANSGSNPALIKFNQSSVTLYGMTIEDNYFSGIDRVVIAPAGKTTTNQFIRMKDNNYSQLPTFNNLAYIQPDKASAAQIAISTCGQNGDICWNVNPSVGEPIGWIMTNSTHYTGTWRALPNLT